MTQIKINYSKKKLQFFDFWQKLFLKKIKNIGKKCGSVFIFDFLGLEDKGPKHM